MVPALLVAEILKLNVPLEVVVPLSTPVVVLSETPNGNAPDVTANVALGTEVVRLAVYVSPKVSVWLAPAKLVNRGLSQMVIE